MTLTKRSVLLALTLAVAGVVAPTTRAAATNDGSCRPQPAHPEPVVLVHGGGIIPGIPLGQLTWQGFAPVLEAQGYCVFIIEYSWERSMTYQPPGTFGAGGATQLEVFIRQVQAATGAARVDVVAHSLGAPIARSFLTGPNNAARVDDLVMLGGTNHQLDPASVAPLLIYPSVRQAAGADGGAFMAGINGPNGERETVAGVDYTALGLDEESHAGNPFVNAVGGDVSNLFLGDSVVAVNDDGRIPMWPWDPAATHDVDVFAERPYLSTPAYAPRRACAGVELDHPNWPNHPSARAAILEALAIDGPLPRDFTPPC